MASSGPRELKCSRMVKRSQGKKRLGVVNYRERVFVLTERALSYYDGNLVKRGSEKGCIELSCIKAVEDVDVSAFERPNAFQVMHDNLTLYIVASTPPEHDEWVYELQQLIKNNVDLLEYYHPGVFSSSKWSCCHHNSKHSLGCKATFITRMKHSHGKGRSNTEQPGSTKAVLPRLAMGRTFDVIAIYDFTSPQPGDLGMAKGQRLTVFDDSREHWWHAENSQGETGFIPSNYVRRIGVESEEWFMSNISRQRAEGILKAENKEGCFLVRNSSKEGMYTLSVSHADIVRHYHIRQDESRQYYISERHRFETISELIEYHQLNGGGLVTRLRRPPMFDKPQEPPTRDKWEIDPTQLTLGRELGSGQFGRVVQGTYKGSIHVAIKMLKEGSMDEDDFIEEAKVMKNFQHANLIQLYGVVTAQRPIYIVTELMANGCLLNFLRKSRQLQERADILIDMTIQVCNGMKFLEGHKFIHRDLAARNCLVGDKFQVKVGDFGLARYVLDDEYTASEGTKFPIKWAAPEVISFAKFSSKSDVWSFGILVWELFTGGKTPYPSFNNSQVLDQVLDGYRLERPPSCPAELYSIVQQTWLEEAEDRPSFEIMYKQLVQIGDDYSDPDATDRPML
eukprot:scpid36624/ scgid29356/ Tyrosine-protein kinase BTK; Bruton tyrosine kinase